MSADGSQRVIMAWTYIKAALRQPVFEGLDQRLVSGFTAAQSIELNPMKDQIDMSAKQAMGPEWIDLPTVPQYFDAAAFVGSAQINKRARGRDLPIDVPIFWKGPSWKVVVAPLRQVSAVSLGKALRSNTERRQIFMMKARPDLLLPQTVKVFDDGLKAGFQRRRKNWSDAQSQAEAHDPADYVRMIMSALKTHIVVELGKGWQTMALPMGMEGLENKGGRGYACGPGFGQGTPQCSRGKQLKKPQVLHPQILHHIEAIQLGQLLGHAWQIPARRRRRTPHSTPAVQQSLTFKNAADGAHAGQFTQFSTFAQGILDSLCAHESQGPNCRQLLAHQTDLLFQTGRRFVGDSMRGLGAAAPINLLQRQNASALYPALHGMQRNSETTSHRPPRVPAPNQRNHLPASAGLTFSSHELPNQSPLVDPHALSVTRPSSPVTWPLTIDTNCFSSFFTQQVRDISPTAHLQAFRDPP